MSDNENELEQKYYHSEQVENYIDNVENGFISSVDNANNENMEDNTYSFNFADSKYLNSEKVYRDVADVMYRNDENYQALLKQNITYSLAGLFPTIFGSVGLFSSAIWNIMDVMNGVGIKDYFYREEPSKSDDDDKNNDDNTEENTL